MRITYAPRALADLLEIENYLASRNPAAVRLVLARIKRAIDDLLIFPRIGRPIDGEGRYRMPVVRAPYLIFYRISGPDIFILHIRHGARRELDPDEIS